MFDLKLRKKHNYKECPCEFHTKQLRKEPHKLYTNPHKEFAREFYSKDPRGFNIRTQLHEECPC